MNCMRAAVLKNHQFTVTEMAVPDPGKDEILLRVERASICGTDLHLMKLEPPAAILGHEFSGTIVDVGTGVSTDQFKRGQVVTSMPTKACGHCVPCLTGDPKHCASKSGIGLSMPANGGFAEYVLVGAHETFVLPQGIDASVGTLVESMAVGLKQAEQCLVRPGDKLVVLGAGPAGLSTILWASAMGVGDIVVSDPLATRRELALKMGATAVVDPQKEDVVDFCQRELGGSPQVVMECTGWPGSYDLAMTLVASRGRVVIGGLHMDPESMHRFVPFIKEVDVRYCWMYEKRHFVHTLNMLAQQRINPKPMVTHEITLEQLPQMMNDLSKPNNIGKVLVCPGKI